MWSMPAARFFLFARRIFVYEGVLAGRLRYEEEKGTPAPRADGRNNDASHLPDDVFLAKYGDQVDHVVADG